MGKSIIYSETGEFLPENMELKKKELKKVLYGKNCILKLVESKKEYRKCRKVLFVAEYKGE